MNFCLAVLVAGCVFAFVDECIFRNVETSGCQSRPVHVYFGTAKHLFCFVGVGLGVQALRSVLGDEAAVAGDVAGSRDHRILHD